MAGSQVLPLSVDTSTRATTPPPLSAAVPLMVTGDIAGTVTPELGVATVTVGPTVSVDWLAATRVDWRVTGCTPMSASRFTVACSCTGSSLVARSKWVVPRPQAHCTVPELNTSAPEGSRYSVRLCVAVPLP